jgi:hypothetical protein
MRKPLRRAVLIVSVVLGGVVVVSSFLQRWGGDARPPDPAAPAHVGGRVTVEVLNGGGRSGAAREATEQLRTQGFDVVYFGNAESFDVDSSSVVDRIGNRASASDVAQALGIRNVRSEPDSTLYVDVSVVLGKDWQPASDAQPPAADEALRRAWWDPRGWFGR